jgi:hypothetical protein
MEKERRGLGFSWKESNSGSGDEGVLAKNCFEARSTSESLPSSLSYRSGIASAGPTRSDAETRTGTCFFSGYTLLIGVGMPDEVRGRLGKFRSSSAIRGVK